MYSVLRAVCHKLIIGCHICYWQAANNGAYVIVDCIPIIVFALFTYLSSIKLKPFCSISVKQKAKKLSLLINENWDEQREAWVQLKFKGAENEEREPVQA